MKWALLIGTLGLFRFGFGSGFASIAAAAPIVTLSSPDDLGNVIVGQSVTVRVNLSNLPAGDELQYVAATVMNGSNAAKSSPLFHDFGVLRVLGLNGTTLSPVAETKIGHWCQGVAWSNNQTVLVQCMVEKEIQTYTLDGKTLKQGASIKINGGPAGIHVAR